MQLLTARQIPSAGKADTVFRISRWGALAGYSFAVLVMAGLLTAFVAMFFAPEFSGFHWLKVILGILLGLLTLLMWLIAGALQYSYTALGLPSNWLLRIGPCGVMIKYRSYIHFDSPQEDPVAIHLDWHEIDNIQRYRETVRIREMGEVNDIRHDYLMITLKPGCHTPGKISKVRKALEFEAQRKPAHFQVDALQHELFIARKNKAGDREIRRLKQAIQEEKKRHPGRHNKTRFKHRPVIFIAPDTLKIEWTHAAPEVKTLNALLAQYGTETVAAQRTIDMDTPKTSQEFAEILHAVLSRGDEITALKLIRAQFGYSISEAKAYIDNLKAAGLS
ncbi:MAG: hypothetical protein H6936_02850 [Burkholderiales bacterium]|nr:hypothetical protein [Nitrosomonas sp.]MCP5273794.1 hypothetical protein [Burkholderiales bacterium]